MATQLRTMTADELLEMPDDGVRRELVMGEVREMTPTGWRHGKIAAKIDRHLGTYVLANRLGDVVTAEAGFVLATDPDTVRAPDVAFVRQERIEEVGDTAAFWPGAPDLAVEVISPGDRYSEVFEKVDEYLAAGTRMVILADPQNRSVTVIDRSGNRTDLGEDGVIDGGDVVPGWRLPVHDVFA